jgi:hypothetical protein
MSAADHLFNEAERSAKEAKEHNHAFWWPMSAEHWLVYPIYSLYRHAIELSLKDLLRAAQRQGELKKDQEELINNSHDVWKLWEAAKPWIMKFVEHGLNKETPPFETMLKEIQTHDPNAEAGKYDMQKIGKKKNRQLVATFEGLSPLDVNAIRDNALKMLNYIRWIWSLYEEHQQQEESRRAWEEEREGQYVEYLQSLDGRNMKSIKTRNFCGKGVSVL